VFENPGGNRHAETGKHLNMDLPIIDILLIAIVAGVAWCVSGEGAWGAGLTCGCTLFGGLLTMNFFEPVANWLGGIGFIGQDYADVISLSCLFAFFVSVLRWATENLSPTSIDIDGRLYQVIRWGFSVATGYITMAFLLTTLHTTPLPRTFIGFTPERNNFLEVTAPDRWWLGFNQYVSEVVFRRNKVFDGPELAPVPGSTKMVWPSFTIRYATRRELHGRPAPKKGLVAAPAAVQGGSGAAPSGGF
jgi:hypothetical protein